MTPTSRFFMTTMTAMTTMTENRPRRVGQPLTSKNQPPAGPHLFAVFSY
jgi:hypothetical protein